MLCRTERTIWPLIAQSLDQVRRADGRAPLVRVYPREACVHGWREGLEPIFLPARESATPVLSIIRFNDGCTPQLGGELLYSRGGRALAATWRSKRQAAGLTAYPDVSLCRAADGSFLASTSDVADAVVVRIVADQKGVSGARSPSRSRRQLCQEQRNPSRAFA